MPQSSFKLTEGSENVLIWQKDTQLLKIKWWVAEEIYKECHLSIHRCLVIWMTWRLGTRNNLTKRHSASKNKVICWGILKSYVIWASTVLNNCLLNELRGRKARNARLLRNNLTKRHFAASKNKVQEFLKETSIQPS